MTRAVRVRLAHVASGELRCVMDLFPLVTSPVIHLMI